MLLMPVGVRYGAPQLYETLIEMLGVGAYVSQEHALGRHFGTDLLHRVAGGALLTAGMLQFHAGLRQSQPCLHRWMGRFFLLLAMIAGVSGVYIGLALPFGGWQESVFIVLVGSLLLWFATMGFIRARRREFARHREWMIRALALPFFVVLQRVYFVAIAGPSDVLPREAFVLAGWLALISVLVAAEAWVHLTSPVQVPATA